jgi:hypothetical protein
MRHQSPLGNGIMLKLEEYGPADYIILYDRDGYKGFFDRIIRAAFARHRRRTTIKLS